MINPGFYRAGETEWQKPFDVAVVMTTIGRPTILEAIRSIYQQVGIERIQLLIGVDVPNSDFAGIDELFREAPSHVSIGFFYPGYSTSVRHGGIHKAFDGGAMRTMLSYLANARYLAYLDDDNWYAPNHLRSMLDCIPNHPWCFSLRWFVDPDSRQPICLDYWESIGPGKGIFNERWGGWTDPNTIMIDKMLCEDVLRWWSIPLQGDQSNLTADRHIFHWLNQSGLPGETNQATVFYVAQPHQVVQSRKLNGSGLTKV